jgi:hypothetical protein
MKNLLALGLAALLTYPSCAQKTETVVALNSGLFSFQGVSATETSQINLFSDRLGYTNNPFGSQNGFSMGVSYQIQHISKGGFIAGVSLGYELLSSRLTVDAVNTFDGRSTVQVTAVGHSHLLSHFINGFPYLGYRFIINPISLDLTAGMDIGYILMSHESGQVSGSNGIQYSTFGDRTGTRWDIRPRLQLSAYYGRVGIYGGYAYGLVNYRAGWVGGQNQCHSELIRFGILYKLRG